MVKPGLTTFTGMPMPNDTIVQLYISPSYVPVDSSVTLINSKIIDALEGYSIKTVVLTVATEDTWFRITPRLSEIFPSDRKVYRVRSYEKGKKTLISLRTLLRKLLPFIFFIPDFHFIWEILAIKKLFKIRNEHTIDIIHSVSAPHSSHIVGYCAKLLFKRPWVCHLDDFWWNQAGKHYSIFRPVNKWLEKNCFQKADIVLSTSREILSFAEAHYADDVVKKFVFIPPCYEPKHYPRPGVRKTKDSASSKYRLKYLGVFYPGRRDPVTFLKAIEHLKSNNHDIYHKLEVNFIGGNAETYTEYAKELDITDAVSFNKSVDYLTATKLMKESELLIHLGFMRNERSGDIGIDSCSDDFYLSGKLFEYIGAKRLIFAITTPSGPVADFIIAHKGVVADYRDPFDIARKLKEIVTRYSVEDLHKWSHPHSERLYSSRAVAKQYYELFRSLCRGRKDMC